MYKEGDGVVVVDLSAANPLGTVSHEMTHWMREYNADGYIKFRDAAVNALMRNGMDLEEEIEKYRDAYREQQGQELSREDAIEEVVADSTGRFLNDEQFIKETVQGNPTMAQRVVEWLKSVCDALKELISDRGLSRVARYIARNLATYERARDLWMKEIETAKDAFELFEPDNEKKAGDKFKSAESSEITEERLEENYDYVRNMKPVYALTGKEFMKVEGASVDTRINEEYRKIGNMAVNPIVGEIKLNKSAIRDSMNHALGSRFRVAAFAAVPDVIENGKILSYIENWKGKPEDDRVVIGAKITYDGKNAYEIVVAKVKTRTNTLYLQDVLLQKENSGSRSAAADNSQPVTDTGFLESSYSNIFKKLLDVNCHAAN